MTGIPARMGRPLFCLLLSLVLHAAAAVAAVLMIRDLWGPRLEITWLDLDNRLGAPQPGGAKTPASPKQAPSETKPPPKPKPQPEPSAAPPSESGDERADAEPSSEARAQAGSGKLGADKIALNDLAPGDAALILLMRMDRIRRSPYDASVRRLLEVFYDHKTILWSSGLDPVNDFDALLIATPNPYRVTETFLAARSARPVAELRRALERAASFGSKRLRWVSGGGGAVRGEIPSPPKLPQDPRVIWLRSDVVVLTDPKQVASLTATGPATDAGTPGPSWLARLGLMGDRGGRTGPGLLLQVVNLSRLVALPADLPAPQSAQIAVEAEDPARVESALNFASAAAAKNFVAEAKKRIERVRQSDDRASRVLRWLGVADLLASIRFQRKDAVVNASVQLGEKDVKALLEIVRSAIPQVRVPGMPERRPIDAGPRRSSPHQTHSPDAGAAPGDR